ncbi:MAG: transglycosylase SLT domain-containing protein [Paraperlucidibaca sp.]
MPALMRVLAVSVLVWIAPAMAADSDYLAAREAFRAGDDAALAKAKRQLSDSPLRVYADFWQLWRRLKLPEAMPEVEAFLTREKGSYLAEKLRMEWLEQLAKRSDWAGFQRQYPLLVDTPNITLQCYSWQAQIAAKPDIKLPDAVTPLWYTAKDLSSACLPVQTHLQRTGLIDNEATWARFRLAMEANAQGLARYLAQSLGFALTEATQQQVRDRPEVFLSRFDATRRLDRELAIWAYGRWARTNLPAALTHLEVEGDELAEQSALAWRQLAMTGARQFNVDSEVWFTRSDAAPWSDLQREARLRLLVRLGQWSEYVSDYAAMPESIRQARPWRFWAARANSAMSTGTQLTKSQRKYYENTAQTLFAGLSDDDDYYGLLARERLGRAMAPVPEKLSISDNDRSRLANHAGFQRAFALYGLAQRWESANEFNWSVRGADDRLLLTAANQANAMGWYDRAIYAAERTRADHALHYRFISPYRDITRAYAKDMGLDEAWVYGLMRQESRFAPQATSGAGANGLMQLMPGTAQWVAKRLGIPYSASMTNDAGQNVQLGTYYLRHVEDTLGHPVLATAGYNAGPRRALEWQGDKPLDATQYIESIPFPETRDYVKKVMANAVNYARLFGQGETTLSVRLGTIPAREMTPIVGP